MRYYFIDQDSHETYIDLILTKKTSGVVETIVKSSSGEYSYFLRSVGGKYFVSEDQVSWRKIPIVSLADTAININQALKVYRGFKPSGLFSGNAGDLVTDMPGKIVKINALEGDQVKKGDTIIILEAMKMENEIKAGLDGIVKAIYIQEGEAVDAGCLMLEIE